MACHRSRWVLGPMATRSAVMSSLLGPPHAGNFRDHTVVHLIRSGKIRILLCVPHTSPFWSRTAPDHGVLYGPAGCGLNGDTPPRRSVAIDYALVRPQVQLSPFEPVKVPRLTRGAGRSEPTRPGVDSAAVKAAECEPHDAGRTCAADRRRSAAQRLDARYPAATASRWQSTGLCVGPVVVLSAGRVIDHAVGIALARVESGTLAPGRSSGTGVRSPVLHHDGHLFGDGRCGDVRGSLTNADGLDNPNRCRNLDGLLNSDRCPNLDDRRHPHSYRYW